MNKQNTITEKAEKLIDFFADKTLNKGCEILVGKGKEMSVSRIVKGVQKEFYKNGFNSRSRGCKLFVEILRNNKNREKVLQKVYLKDLDGGFSSVDLYIQKILGKPVYLHDVLDKLMYEDCADYIAINRAIMKWHKCGIKKSLNELFAEEAIENDCDGKGNYPTWNQYEFKDKNIQNLAEFLWELFSKDILK